MRPLLALPVLLLAGCSHISNNSNYYANLLNLPALPTPRVLAPIPQKGEPKSEALFGSITSAQTPDEADTVVSRWDVIGRIVPFIDTGLTHGEPARIISAKNNRNKELNLFLAYLNQAAKIKRAQLENGDNYDTTGEVTSRIKAARQCDANLNKINQAIPTPKRPQTN